MSLNRGAEFHGELSSADASSGTLTLTYFTPGGDTQSILTTDSLLITDVTLISVPGGAVSINAVKTSDTTQHMSLFAGTVAANAGLARALNTPFTVPPGWSLLVKAPSGQVDVQIEGAKLTV